MASYILPSELSSIILAAGFSISFVLGTIFLYLFNRKGRK